MSAAKNLAIILINLVIAGGWQVASGSPEAEGIYQESMINVQLNSFPATIIASLQYAKSHEASATLSEDKLHDLTALVQKSFDMELARGMALSRLDKDLSAQDRRQIIGWLQSPLGKRITHLEDEASGDQGLDGLDAFLRALQAKPPARTYQDTMDQLMIATHSHEVTNELAILITKITLASIMAANGELSPASYQESTALVDDNKTAIMRATRNQNLEFLLYTYRDLSEEELRRYTDFNISEYGKRYNAVVYDILSSVLQQASDRFLQSLYRWEDIRE